MSAPFRSALATNLENRDSDRLVAIAVTIILLFFYTRGCPFPSGTFWDLVAGRDFTAINPWVLTPERISCLIAQSPASLTGLKAMYHVVFFLLCGVLTVRAFRAVEALPGIIVLCIFAFSTQPLLSLRDLLQMLMVAIVLSAFDSQRLKNSFGFILIPISAIASVLGLATWLIPGLVVCHIAFGRKHGISLLVCSLAGMLLFLDSSYSALFGTPSFSARFPASDTLQLQSILAGIFLIPNLLALPQLSEEELPTLVFYTLTGITALLNPAYLPVFILVGAVLLMSVLAGTQPLSLNINILGILFLAVVFHLFLFLSPVGFRINPSVRHDMGNDLEPLLSKKVKRQKIQSWQVGEMAWKGLIPLVDEDLPLLDASPALWVVENTGKYALSCSAPDPTTASEEASSSLGIEELDKR